MSEYYRKWYERNRERLRNKRLKETSPYKTMSYYGWVNYKNKLATLKMEKLKQQYAKLKDRLDMVEDVMLRIEYKQETGALKIMNKEYNEWKKSRQDIQ